MALRCRLLRSPASLDDAEGGVLSAARVSTFVVTTTFMVMPSWTSLGPPWTLTDTPRSPVVAEGAMDVNPLDSNRFADGDD